MKKVALVGKGRWGQNIFNTLQELPDAEVVVVAETTDDAAKLLERDDLDGVLVATPGSTHAAVALPFIEQGMATFIEKPLATSVEDAELIRAAAARSGAAVFVGHIHLYNPAFLTVQKLASEMETIRSLNFDGMNQGPVRDDMSVLWDWGPHAVSMGMALVGTPVSVQAWGTLALRPETKLYDEVTMRLVFENDLSMTCRLSWMAPYKRVQLAVVGEESSVVLDETIEQKVAVYERTTSEANYPEYDTTPPLTAELAAFIASLDGDAAVRTDVQNGLDVVKVLAAAEQSLELDGERVEC